MDDKEKATMDELKGDLAALLEMRGAPPEKPPQLPVDYRPPTWVYGKGEGTQTDPPPPPPPGTQPGKDPVVDGDNDDFDEAEELSNWSLDSDNDGDAAAQHPPGTPHTDPARHAHAMHAVRWTLRRQDERAAERARRRRVAGATSRQPDAPMPRWDMWDAWKQATGWTMEAAVADAREDHLVEVDGEGEGGAGGGGDGVAVVVARIPRAEAVAASDRWQTEALNKRRAAAEAKAADDDKSKDKDKDGDSDDENEPMRLRAPDEMLEDFDAEDFLREMFSPEDVEEAKKQRKPFVKPPVAPDWGWFTPAVDFVRTLFRGRPEESLDVLAILYDKNTGGGRAEAAKPAAAAGPSTTCSRSRSRSSRSSTSRSSRSSRGGNDGNNGGRTNSKHQGEPVPDDDDDDDDNDNDSQGTVVVVAPSPPPLSVWMLQILLLVLCLLALVCAIAEGRKHSVWANSNSKARAAYSEDWYYLEIPIPQVEYVWQEVKGMAGFL
jgi:hypothetical protein